MLIIFLKYYQFHKILSKLIFCTDFSNIKFVEYDITERSGKMKLSFELFPIFFGKNVKFFREEKYISDE